MKKRVIRLMMGLAAVLLIILGLTGLDYLVNEDREEDPVTRNVQAAKKDSYNQYGLPLDSELSSQPFYEDEKYIYYTDRLLKKFQYDGSYMGDAAIIMAKLQNVIPETVGQYFMPIPERIIWEEGHQEQKDLYHDFLEKAKSIVPDKMKFLNVLPLLNEHTNEYLFFRTDSEWTARGAYYGSVLLCESMGIEPIALNGYEEYMYNTFQGTDKQEVLMTLSQNTEIYTKIEGIPEEPLFFYLSPGSKNRALCMDIENGTEVADKIQTVSKSRAGKTAFIGNSFRWALAEGESKSKEKKDKTALILCDFNGQIMVPFLASYYKQVYVINATYTKLSVDEFKHLFQEYDVSDFILLQSAEEFGNVSKNKLLKKIYSMTE